MKPNPNEPEASHEKAPHDFPIVGIGASAGGMAAFERLFRNMPTDSGMAYVVIQHLSPPHKSILPEILQRFTRMPVHQVTDGIEIEPNSVYVIPPSNNLAVMDGYLILLKPPSERGFRFPIDFFFHTLAEARQSLAIGVVLSGIASDGSLGVKYIKSGGGLTIAQEPNTAEFSDMPRNAIATHNIDYILPPEKIGAFIKEYALHQAAFADRNLENQAFSALGTLQKLYYLLRTKTGHDFSLYKQSTLLRRIDRHMKVALLPDLQAYVQFLQDHPEEIDTLFHELLINVTHFFRDPESFEILANKAIRPLIEEKYAAMLPLRIWVAGCASGEEAYSIAILVQEQLEAQNCDVKVQIFATDLDNDAILTARRGIYADGALENVSTERLRRYFIKEDDGFHVKKSIRDMVVFSLQNLLFDPPFSKIDLLCCRNVLIYMQPELQKQLFPLFHYALNQEGYLFLGNSESNGGFHDLFSTINRKHKIYQRKDVANEHLIHTRVRSSLSHVAPAPMEGGMRGPTLIGLHEWTEKELLKQYAPASVIIDEKYNVLYIHGRTGKYLEPSPGETNANLLKMAREGLKAELATAIHIATATRKTVTRHRLRVKTNGDYQYIDLTVRPVEVENNASSLCMVVFEDIPYSPTAEPAPEPPEDATRSQQVVEMERALKEKDDYLTSIINELEGANQELKSANEELLSSNEELQSSNEELETSREELQSINEELNTVNAELQNKNNELTSLNNDVYNLLASTDIGTIFLDLDLELRRFTPAIQRIYNFLPGDVGRPLKHFNSNLNYPRLLEDIQQVLSTLVPKSIEAQTKDGVWYLVNIQPYRTLENMIDGAVITFVDITRQKQRDDQRRLEIILRDSNDAITAQDFQGNIQSWNMAAVQLYGWTEAEALKMNIKEMMPKYLHEGTMDLYRRLKMGENVRSFESKRLARNGRVIDVWVTLSVLFDYTNQPIGVSTTERDISDRQQTDQISRLENRTLKAISAWYQAGAPGSHARCEDVCRVLVEKAGYRLAWIGQLTDGAKKEVLPVYWDGFETEDTVVPPSLQALAKRSQKLVETVLQNLQPVAVRNILTSQEHKGWREAARKYGFNGFLALPMSCGKDSPGVMVIYSDEPEAFIDEEIEYLAILSGGISRKLENSSNGAG